MTDARFPERWLNDRRIMRLGADDFRAFMLSLAWSVSNRTDGKIEPHDLPLVPGFNPKAVAALESSGLWRTLPGGWQITDFADTQTTAAQLKGLDHKRFVDRERQARKRAHDHGDHTLCPTDNCTHAGSTLRDLGRDVTRDTKDRTGQARTGKAFKTETTEKDDGASKPDLATEGLQSQEQADEAWLNYQPVPVGLDSVAVLRA